MKIQDIIRSISSDPLEAFWAMVELAANKLGEDLPVAELRHGRLLRDDTTRVLLEGAAELLLKEDRQAKFEAIVEFLDQPATTGRRAEEFWLRRETSELLIGLVRDVKSVRFSFQAAFRPWLTYAVQMAAGPNNVRVNFSTGGSSELEHECRDLVAVLGLENVCVDVRPPWSSFANGVADFEVMLPPLMMSIEVSDDVSPRILAPIGMSPHRSGRLNATTLSILHALGNRWTPAVILVAEGDLFRMVGAETVVRRQLIETGRLEAVLGVPPGLFYTSTMVKLGLLAVSRETPGRDSVRFVDLSHEHLSHRGTRGRFEFDFDPGTETAALISGPAPTDKTTGRDVSYDEIFEHNFVLTPDRYLNAGLRDRIDMLMRDADAATLPDVVELIRPANLQKSLGEDYTIFEASPGDIGNRGYLDQPGRSFTVDRATYTRALNQRVQPGDVLLSIKGTIGVVGLVPENVPHEGDTAIWTAGQSLMILRPKKRGGMDPITLYEYLTDETVNEFIKSLAGGSVIQNLAMKDLKAFPVPVPSKQIMEDVRDRFMARQALLDEVADIQRRIAAERAEQWPHAQMLRAR
jgi:hypothetical protein